MGHGVAAVGHGVVVLPVGPVFSCNLLLGVFARVAWEIGGSGLLWGTRGGYAQLMHVLMCLDRTDPSLIRQVNRETRVLPLQGSITCFRCGRLPLYLHHCICVGACQQSVGALCGAVGALFGQLGHCVGS